MPQILIYLGSGELPRLTVRLFVSWARAVFPDHAPVLGMAPASDLAALDAIPEAAALPRLAVEGAGAMDGADILVICKLLAGDPMLPPAVDLTADGLPPIYLFDANGHIDRAVWDAAKGTLGVVRPDAENAHLSRHGAIAESKRRGSPFWWFPMCAHELRSAIMAPQNSLGFRAPEDFLELADRPETHVLVTVFGGSCTYGAMNPAGHQFCDILEARLRESARRASPSTEVTVLNFGHPGYTGLEELQTFMMFGDRLRPEVVVAHSGYNDCQLGLTTDPHWLDRFGVIAKPQYKMGRDRTTIINIIRRRVNQFRRYAESAGGAFLYGLQPVYFGKKTSEREMEVFRQLHARRRFHTDLYKEVYPIYTDLAAVLSEDLGDRFCNLHEAFASVPETEDVFGDSVHTIFDGERIIADRYHDRIVEMLPGSFQA